MTAPWRQMENHERVRELTRGWTIVIPSLSILTILLFVAVIPLITSLPVLPDLGLALLVAWRLYRPELIAPWAGLPLGIVADILAGQPIGISATVWPLGLLAIAMIEPRFPLRDLRMDWFLAGAIIVAAKLLSWELLAVAHLPLPFAPIGLSMVTTILFFPLVARFAAWMERQWLVAD